MSLSIREYGSGYPVVLLHAFPLDGRMWETTAKALVEAGFRAIVPDLPGFGRSSGNPEVSGMEFMAREVAETLDAAGVRKAVFCGLSMGGYVLMRLLALRPSFFKALVLCDTTPAADTDEKRRSRRGTADRVLENGSGILVGSMLPALVSASTIRDNAPLMDRLADIVREQPPSAVASALRGMSERPDSTGMLSDAGVDTLLIFGDEDVVTGSDALDLLRSAIRGAEVRIIDRAGHYSNLERPEDFNSALVPFLLSHTDH